MSTRTAAKTSWAVGNTVVIVLALCPRGLIGLLVGACGWLTSRVEGKR